MNYKRLLELFWEFSEHLESLHTLYLDSVIGYDFIHKQLNDHQDKIADILGEHEYAEKKIQDTCAMTYKHLVGKDVSPMSLSPGMKQGDIRDRTKKNGTNYFLLGSQCVVSAYSYWEEYLRIEIGIATDVLPASQEDKEKQREILNQHVTSDFWGDIRYIRNSIVHNRGKANSDMKNCKRLKWFNPDETIELDYEKMKTIFFQMACYRNQLHRMSLPPREPIRIPEN